MYHLELFLELELGHLNVDLVFAAAHCQQVVDVIGLERALKVGQVHVLVGQNDGHGHLVADIGQLARLTREAERIGKHFEALAVEAHHVALLEAAVEQAEVVLLRLPLLKGRGPASLEVDGIHQDHHGVGRDRAGRYQIGDFLRCLTLDPVVDDLGRLLLLGVVELFDIAAEALAYLVDKGVVERVAEARIDLVGRVELHAIRHALVQVGHERVRCLEELLVVVGELGEVEESFELTRRLGVRARVAHGQRGRDAVRRYEGILIYTYFIYMRINSTKNTTENKQCTMMSQALLLLPAKS